MATNIPSALSWEDYKSREPGTGGSARRFMAALNDENRHLANPDDDRAGVEQDEYAGNDPLPPLPERISIVALVKRSPLNVPTITGGMDEATATQAANQYYAGILEAGGPRALALVRAAASEGNKAILKARELGHGDKFSVVSGHTGAAKATSALIAAALEQYPATREDAQASVYQENTSHEESARKTIAKARGKNLERSGFQKLPTDAGKVDFSTILNTFQETTPRVSTSRIHPDSVSKLIRPGMVRDNNEDSETYKKVIGLNEEVGGKINPAFHETIVSQENSPRRYGSLKVPASALNGLNVREVSKSRALFCDPVNVNQAQDALRNAGKDEEIIIGSKADAMRSIKTSARISKVHFDKSSTFALERQGFDGHSARYLKNGMQMIDHVDQVDMFMDKEPNRLNAYLLGYAAAQGKIGTITQDGKELSLSQAQALGAANYMSMAAATRRSLSQGFDVELDDPAAAVGLSLLHDEKDGRMNNKDIRAIQGAGQMTLLDLVETVQNDEKAKEFQSEHRISAQALRLLRNEQAVANAGRNLSHALEEITRNGHSLVGRDDMPAVLQDMENGPNYAIISGDVSVFTESQKRVGIFGERLNSNNEAEAELAGKIAPHLNEIDKAGINRLWMEGATPVSIEPKKGDIVVLNGGLGAYQNDEARTAQDDRDMAGAVTVSFDQVPSVEVYKAGPRGKKGEVVEVQNFGSDVTAPRSARFASAMADRALITNGNDLGERSVVKAAILTQVTEGKRVIAVDPGTTQGTKITQAMVGTKGVAAFAKAGYGNSVLEDPALKSVEGGYAAIRTGANPEKTAQHIKSLVQEGKPLEAKKTVTRTRASER